MIFYAASLLFLASLVLLLIVVGTNKKRKGDASQSKLAFGQKCCDIEAPPAVPRPQKQRSFVYRWLQIDEYRNWLRYDREKDLMYCKTCETCNLKNNFTHGSDNFQNSTLQQHMTSRDHTHAVKTAPLLSQQQEMLDKAVAGEKEDNRIRAKNHLINAYLVAAGEGPMTM